MGGVRRASIGLATGGSLGPSDPQAFRTVPSGGAVARKGFTWRTSFEPLRGRNPTFAVGRGQRKLFFNAVAELRAFRRAYRQALERWRSGLRDAVFPRGTWCMGCVQMAVPPR